jgi:hypothetical protein
MMNCGSALLCTACDRTLHWLGSIASLLKACLTILPHCKERTMRQGKLRSLL